MKLPLQQSPSDMKHPKKLGHSWRSAAHTRCAIFEEEQEGNWSALNPHNFSYNLVWQTCGAELMLFKRLQRQSFAAMCFCLTCFSRCGKEGKSECRTWSYSERERLLWCRLWKSHLQEHIHNPVVYLLNFFFLFCTASFFTCLPDVLFAQRFWLHFSIMQGR